ETAEIQEIVDSEDHLRSEVEKGDRYRDVLVAVTREVAADRLDLGTAGARLRETEKGRDSGWLDLLRVDHKDPRGGECLAANVITVAIVSVREQPDTARTVRERLVAEFQARYDCPFPVTTLGSEP